jgi:hypothetical protein
LEHDSNSLGQLLTSWAFVVHVRCHSCQELLGKNIP